MKSHGLHDVLQADGTLDLHGALPRGLLNHLLNHLLTLDAAINLGLKLEEPGLDIMQLQLQLVLLVVTAPGEVLSMELDPDSDLE